MTITAARISCFASVFIGISGFCYSTYAGTGWYFKIDNQTEYTITVNPAGGTCWNWGATIEGHPTVPGLSSNQFYNEQIDSGTSCNSEFNGSWQGGIALTYKNGGNISFEQNASWDGYFGKCSIGGAGANAGKVVGAETSCDPGGSTINLTFKLSGTDPNVKGEVTMMTCSGSVSC